MIPVLAVEEEGANIRSVMQLGSVTLHVLVTGILGKEYTVGL